MESFLELGAIDRDENPDGFTFGSIVRVWWFHRSLIVLITLCAGLFGLLYLAVQERQYTAEALIKLTDIPSFFLRVGRQTAVDPRQNPVIATHLVFLSSRGFLRKVAEEAELLFDPEFVGEPNLAEAQSELAQSIAVVDALAEVLVVAQRRDSHVISVSATSRDPKKSARIVNVAAELFIEEELARQEASERIAADWLSNNITRLRGELVGLEGQILETASEHDLLSIEQGQFLDQKKGIQVAELTTQLGTVAAKGAQLRATYDELVSHIESQGAEVSLAIAKTPILDELRVEDARLSRQMSELSRELGQRHPSMISLSNQIQDTRQRMINELRDIQKRLENDILVNNIQKEELNLLLASIKRGMNDQNRATAKLIDMRQQLYTNRKAYDLLVLRQQSLEEAKAIKKTSGRIMSPASIPTKKSHPDVLSVAVFISIGAFLLALLGVFLRDRWTSDFGFRNMEDLRVADMRPLGVIPELPKRKARGQAVADYVITNPQSAQSEAMQRIRSRLCKLRDEDSYLGTVTLLASLEPLEGKTTAAIIFARQTAMSGAKTLLIDADIRNPSVHTGLGLGSCTGLCELLEDGNEEEVFFCEDPHTSLTVLQAGRMTTNSADLLHSRRMVRLLEELRPHYEWIFIDSPSLGAVVDGLVLARHVDTTVCVMRWLVTTRSVAEVGIQQLHDAGANLAGVALSRVDMSAGQKYEHLDEIGYYGYYDKMKLAEVN